MNKKNILIIILILMLHAALSLPYLTKFPPLDNVGDESWMMNISYSFLHTGNPIAPMHIGTPISKSAPVSTTHIYSGVLSAFMRMFGNDVISGRLLSFVVSLIVIVVTFYFANALFGRQEAVGASLLLVTNIVFSWHSREARPEMMLLLFVICTAYIFLSAVRSTMYQKHLLFLSAVVATLSVQVHPHGALLAITLLICYLWIFRRNMISGESLFFFSGLFLGTALWIIFNFSLSAESFSTIHRKYLPPILTDTPILLLRKTISGLCEHFSYPHMLFVEYKYHSSIISVMFYVGLLAIVVSLIVSKQRKRLLSLLGLILLPLFAGSFITSAWNWFHYAPLLAMVMILLASSLRDITQLLGKYQLAGYALLVMLSAAGGAADITKNNREMGAFDFSIIKNELKKEIPETATVMGPPLYYFAFTDRPGKYFSILFLEESCSDFSEEMKTFKPDYLLVDSAFYNLTEIYCPAGINRLSYFDASVIRFLKKNGVLVKIIHVPYPNEFAQNRILDHVSVYKLSYDSP